MDDGLKQEILRTIVQNENRMTFAALQKVHPNVGLAELRVLEDAQTLACVDGNWIVLEWWKA